MTSRDFDKDRAKRLDRYWDELLASPLVGLPIDLDDDDRALFALTQELQETAPRVEAADLERLRQRVLSTNGGVEQRPLKVVPVAPMPVYDEEERERRGLPRWTMLAAAVLLAFLAVGGYLVSSERGPFGPGNGGRTTIIPAAQPPGDGQLAVASPEPTLAPSPTSTAIVVPTMTAEPQATLQPEFETTLVLRDIYYDPAVLRVPANVPVGIWVINEGSSPHTVVLVAGLVEPVTVEPGEVTLIQLTLEPGEYEFYCSIVGHREAGMVGWIIATDESSDTAATYEGPADAQITLRDIRFDPPELFLPALVTSNVEIVNEGAAPHNLTIPDLGISIDVPPGETRIISIAPPDAGEWQMHCDIPGHMEAGMVGVLIAT